MRLVERSIVPATTTLIRTQLAAVFSATYWIAAGVAVGLGALAGHAAGQANQAGEIPSRLVADFESNLAMLLLFGLGLLVIQRLSDGGGPSWLHPLHARGLPREAYPLGIILSLVLAAGVVWTAGATGYRVGWGVADTWVPGPALAQAPVVWTGLFLVAVYGAACAALTRTGGQAVALAIGFPVAYGVGIIQYVLRHPDLAMPPMWLRLPTLLMPPVSVSAGGTRALRHLIQAAFLLAPLILLTPRWVGRTR